MEGYTHHKQTIGKVPARIRPALDALLEAMHYAEQTSSDCWEFAIEHDQLISLGLTRNDFRWLVRKGLVEHQREVTLEGNDGRAFRPTGDLTFSESTCFVLTDAGILLAHESFPEKHVGITNHRDFSHADQASDDELSVPTWDPQRRELRLNSVTVKRFKWAAANQETILAAFEEECWPPRIDDPLPPQPEQDPKRRLSDTIKCLNRKQLTPLIHFHGDGTGQGITWELVKRNGSL